MELRDYQVPVVARGEDILKKYKLLYLALQTRTGKTLTSLSIAQRINVKSVLFITKKKAITSIEKDYNLGNFSFDINITNYEQVKKVKQSHTYDLIIIDEAHALGAFPKPSQICSTVTPNLSKAFEISFKFSMSCSFCCLFIGLSDELIDLFSHLGH